MGKGQGERGGWGGLCECGRSFGGTNTGFGGLSRYPAPAAARGGCMRIRRGGNGWAPGSAPKATSGSPERSGGQILLMSNSPRHPVTQRSPGREENQPPPRHRSSPWALTFGGAKAPAHAVSGLLPSRNGQCLSQGHQLPRV